MSDTTSRFACESCGKTYPWKIEYAGRPVRCKCGHTMTGPSQPSAASVIALAGSAIGVSRSTVAAAHSTATVSPPLASDVTAEFEQALAGLEYGLAPDPVAPPAKKAEVVQRPYSTGAAQAAVTSPVLGYAGHVRARSHVEEEVARVSRVKDLYVPCVLITVGVILAFIDAYLHGFNTPVLSVAYVAFTTIVNLVLVFAALMIAIQLLDLGLGPIGTAVLKIIAVAILPGAISGIIGHWTWGMMSWSISLVVYYCMLYSLFEMDSQEMMIVTAIIFGVRFLTSIALIALLASWVGAHLPGAIGAGTGSLGGGPGSSIIGSGPDSSSSSEESTPATQDKEITAILASGKAVEAREWLAPAQKNHAGFKVSVAAMRELTEKFYKAGAKKVWAANMETMGQMEVCAQLIVEMPTDTAARRAVIDIDDKLNEEEQPSADKGNKYLEVGLD